jgi:hypothetical protein
MPRLRLATECDCGNAVVLIGGESCTIVCDCEDAASWFSDTADVWEGVKSISSAEDRKRLVLLTFGDRDGRYQPSEGNSAEVRDGVSMSMLQDEVKIAQNSGVMYWDKNTSDSNSEPEPKDVAEKDKDGVGEGHDR